MSYIKYRPYPIDALPASIRMAVEEHCFNNHTPPALAAMAAITAVSIAFQGGHNVLRPGGGILPLHLFTLAIAEPSERKSSVMRDFCRAIYGFEERHEVSNEHVRDWKKSMSKLDTRIGKEYAKGNPVNDLEAQRQVLEQKRPNFPWVVRLIYENTTFASLLQRLYRDCPHAALLSSEGTIVFKNLRIQDCGMLCVVWDGDSLSFSRKEEDFTIRGARLTVAIMAQIDSVRKFFEKDGRAIREMGFLARMLVAYPESEIGERFIDDRVKSNIELDAFNAKIDAALTREFEGSEKFSNKFEILELSEEAATLYRTLFNQIEMNLSKSGRFYDVRDHASKIPEIMLRMAALFHLMEGREGAIQLDLLEAAAKICSWHLDEYQRLFGKASQISVEFSNRERVIQWFVEDFKKYGPREIRKANIYSYFPGDLRRKSISGPILDELCRDNIIYLQNVEGRMCIYLDQRYFSALAAGQSPLMPSPIYGFPWDPPMVRNGMCPPTRASIFVNN